MRMVIVFFLSFYIFNYIIFARLSSYGKQVFNTSFSISEFWIYEFIQNYKQTKIYKNICCGLESKPN